MNLMLQLEATPRGRLESCHAPVSPVICSGWAQRLAAVRCAELKPQAPGRRRTHVCADQPVFLHACPCSSLCDEEQFSWQGRRIGTMFVATLTVRASPPSGRSAMLVNSQLGAALVLSDDPVAKWRVCDMQCDHVAGALMQALVHGCLPLRACPCSPCAGMPLAVGPLPCQRHAQAHARNPYTACCPMLLMLAWTRLEWAASTSKAIAYKHCQSKTCG